MPTGARKCATSLGLPSDLIVRLLEMLGPVECALVGRLVCKDAWKWLSQSQLCTMRLSVAMPSLFALDATWKPHLELKLKQLSFRGKLLILSTAASSGSETNLELAWGLVQPCLLPELLCQPQLHGQRGPYLELLDGEDAGTAAVRSGHAHLLPWLVQHGCPLDPRSTLEAAVQHCDLAGLEQVWELLGGSSGPQMDDKQRAELACMLARATGRSDDTATAKLSWLLSTVAGGAPVQGNRQRLLASAAVAAAASGSIPTLRWLLEQGLDLRSPVEVYWPQLGTSAPWCMTVVVAILHGHVAVADWLVDEAGCPLPQQEQDREQKLMWEGAARCGRLEAVNWVMGRTGAVYVGIALRAAAAAGRLEVVQWVRQNFNVVLTASLFAAAAGSRSMATASWLLRAGCPMSPDAYDSAAKAGDVAMVEWLAKEAKCPWTRDTLSDVIQRWPARAGDGSGLERALRTLLEAGCRYNRFMFDVGAVMPWAPLPLLRYLREELNGFFLPGTLAAVARGGREAVMEWIVESVFQRVVGVSRGNGDPYVEAGRQGDAATLSCLRRLGVPWGRGPVRELVKASAPLPVIRWVVEHGAPWDEKALSGAVRWARFCGRWSESAAWLAAHIEQSRRPAAPPGGEGGHAVAGVEVEVQTEDRGEAQSGKDGGVQGEEEGGVQSEMGGAAQSGGGGGAQEGDGGGVQSGEESRAAGHGEGGGEQGSVGSGVPAGGGGGAEGREGGDAQAVEGGGGQSGQGGETQTDQGGEGQGGEGEEAQKGGSADVLAGEGCGVQAGAGGEVQTGEGDEGQAGAGGEVQTGEGDEGQAGACGGVQSEARGDGHNGEGAEAHPATACEALAGEGPEAKD